MPYISRTAGPLYIVRWDNPQAGDVAMVEREVADAARSAPGKLYGLSIVPATTRAPDDATRTAMGRSMSKLLVHLETMHVVIEGSGFAHTILRNVMAGIILVGGKRGRVFVSRDVGEALPILGKQADLSRAQLQAILGAHGVLHDRAG